MGEGAEVHGVAATGATDGNGHVLAARLGDFRIPLTQHAQPPAEVAVAVSAWRAIVGADREVHLAPGTHQFFGDLHARGAGADHQHSAFWQLLGVVIGGGVDLVQVAVFRRDGRDHRLLERAGGGDHAVGANHAFIGFDGKTGAVAVAQHFLHFDAGAYGQVVLAYVLLEVVGHLVLAGEGVGVEVEFQPREAVVPDRAVGHQRVPAAGAPGLGDTLALQHQVRHAKLAQVFAHGHAGLAGADDEGVDFEVVQCHVRALVQAVFVRSVWRTAVAWGQTRDARKIAKLVFNEYLPIKRRRP
ncbi:hypothetical protein D3C75_684080 [compost metagenome]